MLQVTASEFKANLGKYLLLANREDIVITKSGKSVAKLSGVKQDKLNDMESLFGVVPWNGENIVIKDVKSERLTQKYASLN